MQGLAKNSGYSLIEIILVIALISTLSAALTPLLMKTFGDTNSYVAKQITTALKKTRLRAKQSLRPSIFTLDIAQHNYRIDDFSAHKLPGNLKYSMTTAADEVISKDKASIRFFPDGSSSGGKIVIDDGKTQSEVHVIWLTGKIDSKI